MNFKVDERDILNQTMQKLIDVRTQISNLKRFEQDYKDKIDKIMAKLELDRYANDKYFVKISQSTRRSLDTNKVKEHLGADIDNFMKESVTTRIDVKEIQ